MRYQLDLLENYYRHNEEAYRIDKGHEPNGYAKNENEELYYYMRDKYNYQSSETFGETFINGTVFYFINKTCFSGMTRYNSKGEFNVPFGWYRSFNTQSVTEAHSNLIKTAKIYNDDYSKIFEMANSGDFVFLDPPYDCVFRNYGEKKDDDFSEIEQRRLAVGFKNLPCKVLMILGKTSFTEELYKNYICEEYSVKYNVNIKNRFDTNRVHLIIKNY